MLKQMTSRAGSRRPEWEKARKPRRRTLAADRRGASAVEFAFIVPVLVLLLIGIIDVGFIMMTQSNITRVANDTARRLSLAQMTETEALTHVKENLNNLGKNLKVEAELPDTDAGETDIRVAISVPLADVIPIDLVGMKKLDVFQNGSLGAQITMRQEIPQ